MPTPKGQQRLHYLHEISEEGDKKRFVYFCSECSCVLNVCVALEPVSDTIESLGNRCPACGSALETRVSCKSVCIPNTWSEISRSIYSTRVARVPTPDTKKVEFQTAASLREFSFNFAPLDALVGHFIDPNWSVVFKGRCANLVTEFLCFRAQLPREAGGSDSSVVLIDGGNRSDLYLFSSFAKLYGVAPRKALRRVVTSRAFTMYQLANLVVNELEKVVEEYGARVVVLSDALGVMNGESGLHEEEARRLAGAVRLGIDQVRKEKKVFTFVTLITETPHNRVMTDHTDILVDIEESSSRIKGTLLRHPWRKQPSSEEFRLRDLLFHNNDNNHGIKERCG
jgi:DNA-directed RNA polymerase subunit RPC12/RpoP